MAVKVTDLLEAAGIDLKGFTFEVMAVIGKTELRDEMAPRVFVTFELAGEAPLPPSPPPVTRTTTAVAGPSTRRPPLQIDEASVGNRPTPPPGAHRPMGDVDGPSEKQVAFYRRLCQSHVLSDEERTRALTWLEEKSNRHTIRAQIDWLKRTVNDRKNAERGTTP
jgi:hypothetical protein